MYFKHIKHFFIKTLKFHLLLKAKVLHSSINFYEQKIFKKYFCSHIFVSIYFKGFSVDHSENQNKVRHCISISEFLHKKLEKHLLVLRKLLRPGHTQEKWIMEAVQEKLLRDNPQKKSKKNKRICLLLDKMTNKLLEDRINAIRPFHSSYSKKKLILEAIMERLESEEDFVKTKLAECKQNSQTGEPLGK